MDDKKRQAILRCVSELQRNRVEQRRTTNPAQKMGILLHEMDWLDELLSIYEEVDMGRFLKNLPKDEELDNMLKNVKLEPPKIRTFESGATRDTNQDKLDYSRFFSSKVLRRKAEYLHKHRIQSNGKLRPGDNWKAGIPQEEYMASLFRHFMDIWLFCEAEVGCDIQEALCALIFNAEGMLHEILNKRAGKECSRCHTVINFPQYSHKCILTEEELKVYKESKDGK